MCAPPRSDAGCDGAHSTVRDTIGTAFPGGTYRQVFYVADVEAAGPPLNGELHVDLDEADFLGVFPLAGKGKARLIGTVRDERADRADTLKFEDVSDRAIRLERLSGTALRAMRPRRFADPVCSHENRARRCRRFPPFARRTLRQPRCLCRSGRSRGRCPRRRPLAITGRRRRLCQSREGMRSVLISGNHVRINPSSSDRAKSMAWSIDLLCCVHWATILQMVPCANICAPRLVGAG